MALEILERLVDNVEVRASFAPKSLNIEKRTIDVVFATDTPCRMFNWEDGLIEETLSMEPAHVRLDRLNGGAPVLDNHSRYEGTRGVLGVVENARIEGGKAVATLRFSKREDVEETFQDIVDGILSGVSVGYRVHKYEITREEGQMAKYRAIDWEGFEISMAPVQADPNSKVRSLDNKSEEELKQKKLINENKNPIQMTELEKRALALNLPQTATLQEVERAEADKARKEKEASDKLASDAVNAERARAKAVNEIIRKAGLDQERSDKLVIATEGKTEDQARALVLDAVAEANETNIRNQNTNVTVGVEAKEKIRTAMVEALDSRANPSVPLTDNARDFAGLSLFDMAKRCAEDAGMKTAGRSQREIVVAAMNLERMGYMSSTDFPLILGNTVNRTLRRAYKLQEPTFMPWTNRGSFKDFRAKTVVQLGDVTKMKQIQEGGEYKYGNIPESAESYKANKYGLIIALTWEAVINDDLGAFSRIPTSISNKARQLQSDLVYSILSANAALGDAIALFDSATHKNYTSSGTAISIASLQVGRTAIRTQKDLNGVDALNLTPKYLVVGPLQELAAYQFTSSNYTPVGNGTINPTYNAQLTVIVDPRITGTEWYLMADPSQIDTVEYSFLEGEELFTDQRIGWEVDGMEMKARMVFNAKAIDYRGMYKNNGA